VGWSAARIATRTSCPRGVGNRPASRTLSVEDDRSAHAATACTSIPAAHRQNRARRIEELRLPRRSRRCSRPDQRPHRPNPDTNQAMDTTRIFPRRIDGHRAETPVAHKGRTPGNPADSTRNRENRATSHGTMSLLAATVRADNDITTRRVKSPNGRDRLDASVKQRPRWPSCGPHLSIEPTETSNGCTTSKVG
jgi:hypothetical protein